jgi:hypothetical protein
MNLALRLVNALALALLEALAVLAFAGALLGFSPSEWTPSQTASVGLVATFASIAMANLFLICSWRGARRS